jgi:hypothetical protein
VVLRAEFSSPSQSRHLKLGGGGGRENFEWCKRSEQDATCVLANSLRTNTRMHSLIDHEKCDLGLGLQVQNGDTSVSDKPRR